MTKKAVLISIRPKWCELIAKGKKTVEIRKTFPKLETPFRCYIYCTEKRPLLTRGKFPIEIDTVCVRTREAANTWGLDVLNGKVIGEFVCDTILRNCEMANADIAEAQSCVKREKILEYSGGHEVFGWHVSDLVIYDTPKELSEFSGLRQTKFGLEPVSLKRPPQSWCYVESEEK